jgi:hypothetical protein
VEEDESKVGRNMYDIYSRFLGVYATERPLERWQLLGVMPEEKDAAVLEEAALQRFDQIRPYVLKYPQEATQLLNEIAQALATTLAEIREEKARIATKVKPTTVAVPTPEADEPARLVDAQLFEVTSAPTSGTVRVKKMGKHVERPGKVTMLVLCQGNTDGSGDDLTVWQIKLKKMSISSRQRRKLQALAKSSAKGVRARILRKVGRLVPAQAVAAMVKKGIAALKHLWDHEPALPYAGQPHRA